MSWRRQVCASINVSTLIYARAHKHTGSRPRRARLSLPMDKSRLPADVLALNAQLVADPSRSENMGPVHVLTVTGRKSGKPHTTPVSPVTLDGHRWIVAGWPDADWVKNLRANGSATLVKGSRSEQIRATEAPLAQAARALQAFVVERGGGPYAFELDPNASLETFAAEVERHPVFRIEN